jgi:hypothetical protein
VPIPLIDGACYGFRSLPGRKATDKSRIECSSLRFTLEPEAHLIQADEAEYPNLMDLWHFRLSRLPQSVRQTFFDTVLSGMRDHRFDNHVEDWSVCLAEAAALGDAMKEARLFLQDPTFRSVVDRCSNIARWLGWRPTCGSRDVQETRNKVCRTVDALC